MSYILSKEAFDKLCSKDIVWDDISKTYVDINDLHLNESCYLETINHRPKDNNLNNAFIHFFISITY